MNTTNTAGFSDLQFTDIEIERHGIEKKFRVRELTGEEASKVLSATKSNGKPDRDKAKTIDARLVAKTVTEIGADGNEREITFNEAQQMGLALRRRLVAEAMAINGLDDDKDDEKN